MISSKVNWVWKAQQENFELLQCPFIRWLPCSTCARKLSYFIISLWQFNCCIFLGNERHMWSKYCYLNIPRLTYNLICLCIVQELSSIRNTFLIWERLLFSILLSLSKIMPANSVVAGFSQQIRMCTVSLWYMVDFWF